MPSWQAHLISAHIRVFLRRRRWGDNEREVAARARRLMGAPRWFQWYRSRGLPVETVPQGEVRGEWVGPESPERGVILYIHGGGFVSGSPATHRPITAALARLSGQRVFALEYRLAPEHRVPLALDDCVAAYRWLIEDERIPSGSISLAGDSAGGGLVLGTLLRIRDSNLKPTANGRLPLPRPACAVCFSPWTDLADTGAPPGPGIDRCAMFYKENIKEFAAAYLGGGSPTESEASPVFARDFSNLPPLLIQVGSTEILLDDSVRVHKNICDAGGDSTLRKYEKMFHCWQMLDGFVPEAREALLEAAAFIRGYTSPHVGVSE